MAGTDRRQTATAPAGPAVILVEPQLGENIGMVARAMTNFGLTDLRLVSPRDGWPNERALATASGASAVIETARAFPDLAAATAELSLILATTARPRDMIKPVLGPREAALRLAGLPGTGQGAGILFGRERWGLTNDEIARADAIVTFPVEPGFASLNLAQAVLLVAYEWRLAQSDALPFETPATQPASRADLDGLAAHLVAELDRVDYFHPPEKRERMELNLVSMIHHAGFTEPETRTLRGVIAALSARHLRGGRS